MMDIDAIVGATGCPKANVDLIWPFILASLDREGINTPMVQVAAIATIATETPVFLPVREKYNGSPEAYFGKLYWQNKSVAHQLGNLSLEDAIAFYGRGLIQITGRDNYELYGELLGLPLDRQPDLALVPNVAANILALFFRRQRVSDAAEDGDWQRARIRVNGGLKGWPRFAEVARKLGANVIT